MITLSWWELAIAILVANGVSAFIQAFIAEFRKKNR